jgi:hypothetical protein
MFMPIGDAGGLRRASGGYMAYCTACGHLISDNARFCRSCGAPQGVQMEQESQLNPTAKPPSGAPEHAAELLGQRQVVNTSSSEDAVNGDQRRTVVKNSSPREHKPGLPTVTCSTRSSAAATSALRERLYVIIPVATSVVLAGAVWWWSSRTTVPSSSASQESGTASQPLPRAKLMTQDQNFVFLLECDINCNSKTEQLVKFSPSWQQADKEAEASTTGITDPEMKARAWQNKFDEIKNKFGGDDVFRTEGAAEVKKRLHQYLQEHKDDLFEVARFDSYDSRQQILEVNPSFDNNNVSMVNVSLLEMDAVLTRFRAIEASAIDQVFHELKAEAPEVARAFEQEGMRAEIPSDEEERRIAEGIVLKQHVSLAAKGDPAEPRLDALYLVDSPSGVILTQLSKGVVKENQQGNTAPASNAAPLPSTAPSDSGENKAVQPVLDTAQSDKTASNAAAAAARPVSHQTPSGCQWVSTSYGGYCK